MRGERATAHVVHASPLDQLLSYAESGASWAHIVDLNAAFSEEKNTVGRTLNRDLLRALVKSDKLKLEVGGGVRSLDDAQALLDLGVHRVVIGTWCAKNPEAVMKFAQKHPEKVVAGLDSLQGKVAVHGWTVSTNATVEEFGEQLHKGGVRYGLFTEVERDGLLTGIDAKKASQLAHDTGLKIIASGGVRDIIDIENLSNSLGVCAVVVGKALAAGTLTLKDALRFERT